MRTIARRLVRLLADHWVAVSEILGVVVGALLGGVYEPSGRAATGRLLRREQRWLALLPHKTATRGLPAADCGYPFRGLGEPELGHVGVDRLVVSASHDVGLVPDADGPLLLASLLKRCHAGMCGSSGSLANFSRCSNERQYWTSAGPRP